MYLLLFIYLFARDVLSEQLVEASSMRRVKTHQSLRHVTVHATAEQLAPVANLSRLRFDIRCATNILGILST